MGRIVDFGDKSDVRYDLGHIHISEIKDAHERFAIREMYEKSKNKRN